MKHLIAITSCPTGVAHTLLAAEALKKTAASLGVAIKVETQGSVGARTPLTDEDIAQADAVLLAADVHVDRSRFVGKPIYETRTSEAIRNTRAVIEAALALVPDTARETHAIHQPVAAEPQAPAAGKRLVGITACPTGIAHTFMAANALEVGSSRVDLQACKLEYSIVSPK